MKKKIAVAFVALALFGSGYWSGRHHWRNEALMEVFHYRVYLYGPECDYSAACKEKEHAILALMNGEKKVYVDSQ